MDNFDLPYSEYMQHGRAWSPTWTETRRGFDRWLVLAPPGVETLGFENDYFALLSRRVEWMLEDWLDRYPDELPTRVDLDDPAAIRAGTVAMIEQYVPLEIGSRLHPSQSNRAIAQLIATPALSPNLVLPAFPVALPPPLEADDFATCITEDSTLKGWLIEVSP